MKPHDLDLAAIEADVRANGPRRVLVSRDGLAASPRRARQAGVIPDVVFVRDDGWTLGAPAWLREAAHALWADSWVHEFRLTH